MKLKIKATAIDKNGVEEETELLLTPSASGYSDKLITGYIQIADSEIEFSFLPKNPDFKVA